MVAKSLSINLPELPKGLYYTVYAWANSPLKLKNFWFERTHYNPEKVSNSRNVLCNYKLVDAVISENKIEKLIFVSNENRLIVKAEVFIIGLGGIENARFAKRLNLKNNYIKKEHTKIGNFQEHPHLYGMAGFNSGKNSIPKILKERVPYVSKGKVIGKIKFAVVAWDGLGTPKVSFEIKSKPKVQEENNESKINSDTYLNYDVRIRCEQTPNPGSYLNFSDTNITLNI